jgi:hypothetical protein
LKIGNAKTKDLTPSYPFQVFSDRAAGNLAALDLRSVRATCSLGSLFSHFNRKTSLMVRMDNLSAVMVTSRVFLKRCSGFHRVYPASMIPFPGGGGMDRIQVAEWIRIEWRNETESGGAFNRIWVADCSGIRTPYPLKYDDRPHLFIDPG